MRAAENHDARARQSARRRGLIYRGFATAAYGQPRGAASRSFIRPHSHALCEPHLAAAHAQNPPWHATAPGGAAGTYRIAAAAPLEAVPLGAPRRALSPIAKAAVGGDGGWGAGPGGAKGPSPSSTGAPPLRPKLYPEPLFKGLLSAFGPKAFVLSVVKAYALSFGSITFGAEMEEQPITDEQIQTAHRVALELMLRELATVTLRRALEKLCIQALDRRWSTKLLKDASASARRKAARDGRVPAAMRIALTSLRSTLLVHLATWAVEALIDVWALYKQRIQPRACARMILHRAVNRVICALAGAAGASVLTLFLPGMGTYIGALLAESAAPYLTTALLGDVHTFSS